MKESYKNYFPLPNEIFSLNLCPGEIAVYSYLLYCEDRKTYQCYPSYRTIGRAVGNENANRNRKIIRMRYGLLGTSFTGEEMTQRDIGKKLGISRSYVSRIEKKALGKLKAGLEEEKLC